MIRVPTAVLAICIIAGCSSGDDVREFKGHQRTVHSVTYSPDGKYILSGADDGMFLWNEATGKEIHRYSKGIYSVAFSPDGCRIISAGFDKTARLWDVEKWTEVRRFEGHQGYVYAVAFSPDGSYVLSGAGISQEKEGKTVFVDCTIRLWDVNTGKELRRFEGHKGPIGKLAFSRDGKQFLSSSGDGTIRLWEVATGKELRCWDPIADRTIEFPGGSVDFSADGRYALVGGLLYDAQNWQLLRKVRGDVFSSDGKRSLTANKDLIQLWDLESGKELWQAYGHKNQAPVRSVAFSPDGKYALSGGQGTVGWSRKPFEDHVIRMWKLPE